MSWVDLRRRSHDPLSAILKDLIKTKIQDEAQSNTVDDIENIVPVLITNSKIIKKDDNIFIAGTSTQASITGRMFPREPDGKFTRLWLKNEHWGNYLADHSKCDNIVELHANLDENGNSIEPKLRLVGTQDFGVTLNQIANETTGVNNQYIKVLDNPNVRIKEIVGTNTGFTVFCRIYITININETLTNRRSVLFSKLDTEQIDYAYMAELSDTGDLYWSVRYNYSEYTIKCDNCITFQPKTDFLEDDYDDTDFDTGPEPVFTIPEVVPFVDLAFTFNFSTKQMTVMKDAEVMVDSVIDGYFANYTPISNLQAFWRITEGEDYSTILDSINNNVGTLNGATWQDDNSLLFDGINDYVNLPNSASLNNFTAFSISLWVYPRSTPGAGVNPGIIAKNWRNAGTFILSQNAQTTSLAFGVSTDGTNQFFATKSSALPNLNQWYHVVCTWTSGGQAKIYVNNAAPATSSTTPSSTLTNSGAITIGKSTDFWDGKIAYVQIYNKALSAAEVTTLFNQVHQDPIPITSRFPAFQRDPPPIQQTPGPITNPFVNFYNVGLPIPASQAFTKLHLKGFTSLTKFYDITDGAAHTGAGTFVTPIVQEYNVQVTSQGGGVGGSVYDLAGTGHHTDITTDSTDLIRVGMVVETGSALIGKQLVRITVRLRTEGTSPTGTIKVGIRKANDSFVQFGADLNVASMVDDSTDRDFTFDLLSNTYPLAVGDRITVEGANVANGHVGVKKHQSGNIPNMTMQDYGSSWSNESGYQMAGTFYEGGTTSTPTGYFDIWQDNNTFATGVQHSDAIYVSAANSPLVGKKITKAIFTVKKSSGFAVTGDIICKVDNTQLGSPIALGSITTSDTIISFTDRNFPNALANGSKIILTLSTASGTNSTNTIQVKHTLSDAFTGANEQLATYSFPGGTTWSNYTAQDLIGTLESGGTTVNDPAYDPWLELDDVTKRVVVYLNAGSALIGKQITKLTARLWAAGAPTGTIVINIRNSADAVVGNLGSLDATLLTATIQSKDFVNVNQPRVLAQDDRISIEYGSGDVNNFVKVAVQLNMDAPNQNAFDTTKTLIKTFNGSAYLTTISTGSANGYDLSGQMYLGGAVSDPTARTRVGESTVLATSVLKGKKLSRVVVYLQKVGTLIGVNDIALRIRKGVDDSIAATIGLFSSNNVPTASPSAITFTNLSQQYALQTGDKVMVEFNGGDDSNYIKVTGTIADAIDGIDKSYLVDYDDLTYRNTTTSDLIGTMEFGGDTYTPAVDEQPPPRDPFYNHDLNILAGGYPWAFTTDTELNSVGQNVMVDFRFERQIFTTQMALNLKNNGCSTSNIPAGKVAKVGAIVYL